MKKKALIISSAFILVTVLVAYGIYWAFFDIQGIKGQQVLTKSVSPNGRYTVTAYLNNGGATVDFAVLCTVSDNATHKAKNIYWQYHCDNAKIEWENDTTVIINNTRLDVRKDIYDYRRN